MHSLVFEGALLEGAVEVPPCSSDAQAPLVLRVAHAEHIGMWTLRMLIESRLELAQRG